ncbi:hypothetical protein SCLCIDRAFT_1221042 [Scleroderma citrinum Foug A]|uniref:HSF-type DNA-binding domain-containing protein n=1 Tax=Scleroderma citrinum Foug A TaxID=1036808 RepID=A0A0C2Z169_9AGAM|nr:hypothetical protein SCLCIDRAFT_1221042 [Scleroderma citrinum Foug A]
MWDSFFGFLASLNPSSLHHPSPSVSTSPALLPIHPPPHIDLGRRHPPFIQSKPPTTPTSTHIIKLKRERQSIQPPLLPYHHHHRKRTDTITHHNERLRPKATGHEHPVYASSLFKHSNFASFVRQLNKCDFHKWSKYAPLY